MAVPPIGTLAFQPGTPMHQLGRTWAVTPDLLSVINDTGCFEQVNPAWQATLGWTESEMRNAPFSDFIHPEDQVRTEAAWTDLQQDQPVLRFENRYRCKDGNWRWLSWVAVPEGGKFYCSARDVTAEKAQAEALRLRNEELDQLWISSPDLLLVVDTDGIVQHANPAWTRLLGYEQTEVVGRYSNSFVVEEDTQGAEAALKAASMGLLENFVCRVRHKDGSLRWFSWASGLRGQNIYATGRHITAEKEAQASLQAVAEQLRQSQKIEAIGQLTGGLAHDFNNLLTGIGGALELLETRLRNQQFDGLDRYIATAQASTRRAAALTQRLLAFARRQTLDPTPAVMNQLVDGMEDLIRRTMGPGVALQRTAAGGQWPVRVDVPQLENALLNLCINARDAMEPDGGRLSIETANQTLDDAGAGQRDLPPGDYVVMHVSDTGAGMTPDVVQHAFDPFFTTKPLGQGTGLGLSMVHGFARQSGGQVCIESTPGRGTCISLYLPRHLRDDQPADAPADAAVSESGRGQVVLVVDDEDMVRELIAESLADSGYTPLQAADGLAALKLLQSNARIDLLMTDVGLPGGMNGRQVAEAARAVRPALQVLFITGYADFSAIGGRVPDAGMHILSKPFELSELTEKVSLLLTRPAN